MASVMGNVSACLQWDVRHRKICWGTPYRNVAIVWSKYILIQAIRIGCELYITKTWHNKIKTFPCDNWHRSLICTRGSWISWQLTHWPLGGSFEWSLLSIIFKLILLIYGWGMSCETILWGLSLDIIDDKSTLAQVMDWCRQATNPYLGLFWPRSMVFGVIRPQWIKLLSARCNRWCLYAMVSLMKRTKNMEFFYRYIAAHKVPCIFHWAYTLATRAHFTNMV